MREDLRLGLSLLVSVAELAGVATPLARSFLAIGGAICGDDFMRDGRTLASLGLGDLDRYVTYGASPRASIALLLGGRALAFLRGRDYVLPQDVSELALDVLRHRLVLSYEALADDIDPDTVIAGVLKAVRAPEVVLQSR